MTQPITKISDQPSFVSAKLGSDVARGRHDWAADVTAYLEDSSKAPVLRGSASRLEQYLR